MGIRFTEKELLATEVGKLPENVARIQAKGGKRQKRRRPHEPVDRMTGLEKQFLYYWRLCGGNNEDWLYGQHPFPERPRMHVDFMHIKHRNIVVEIDGGQWSQERGEGKKGHNSGTGIQRDAEKLMLCNRYGLTLYRLPTSMVSYDGVMEIYRQIEGAK